MWGKGQLERGGVVLSAEIYPAGFALANAYCFVSIYNNALCAVENCNMAESFSNVIDEHPMKKKNVVDTSITWRVFYAYRKVKFFRTDIQGKCDSLVYSGKDSIMRLFKEPVLWQDKNQLTGEKVEIKTSAGEIKNLFLRNNAFIISKEDSVKFNQIKGKQMTGYFKENKLAKIFVEGNGQTIVYQRECRLCTKL